MKIYYQAYINSGYVRDAQVYCADCFSEDIDIFDYEHEDGWGDADGSMLIFDGYYESVDEVAEELSRYYPDASANIFHIKAFPAITEDSKEVCHYENTSSFADAIEVKRYVSPQMLSVNTPAGDIVACKGTDNHYPSIWIELKTKSGDGPAAMMEVDIENNNKVSAHVWERSLTKKDPIIKIDFNVETDTKEDI